MSVIDYVDKALVWDAGSTDCTRKIIEEIAKRFPKKVEYKQIKQKDIYDFTKARQKMLDTTRSDWFLVLDGDEVWWSDSIKKVIKEIYQNGKNAESIVVPTINLVGDIYHYQEQKAGLYRFGSKMGHYNLRAVSKNIPGLKSKNPHGTWGWADEKGKMIQNRNESKVKYVDAPYLHATFLKRSSKDSGKSDVPKRSKKLKYEIGKKFPYDFFYPEVFFQPRPEIVPNPWEKMEYRFYTRALVETPLRKFKRRIFPSKIGY